MCPILEGQEIQESALPQALCSLCMLGHTKSKIQVMLAL